MTLGRPSYSASGEELAKLARRTKLTETTGWHTKQTAVAHKQLAFVTQITFKSPTCSEKSVRWKTNFIWSVKFLECKVSLSGLSARISLTETLTSALLVLSAPYSLWSFIRGTDRRALAPACRAHSDERPQCIQYYTLSVIMSRY